MQALPLLLLVPVASPGDGNYFNDLFIDSIASWIGVRKKYGIDPSSVRHPCGPTHNQLRTRWTEWASVYPLRPPSEDCSLTDRIVGRRYLKVLRGIPSEGWMYDKENSVSNVTYVMFSVFCFRVLSSAPSRLSLTAAAEVAG